MNSSEIQVLDKPLKFSTLCLLTRTMWLKLFILAACLTSMATPELFEPGPTSGIVLKSQPGLLITNSRLYTKKVFVKLNPTEVCRKNLPQTQFLTSWAGARWTRTVIQHAEADITHMLYQLDKFTVTQAELGGAPSRSKRFIGALLAAAAGVGTLFNLGMTSANAVSLASLKRHVNELEAEIPTIRTQINQQQEDLLTVGKTLQGTVLVVNTHSIALNKTLRAVNELISVLQVDFAHTQLVTTLLGDMLRDISSSVDSLAMSRIPPYLVPLTLVQEILATATRDQVSPLQAHLAFTLGSAIPIYVNPENREIAFIINLPVIAAENIYRLKDVINVGSWHGDVHVQIQTPSVVAYHDSNPDLYLAPNLRTCTLTNDIHYLCPSKPFVRDSTDGICGLKPMTPSSRCPTKVTARSRVTETLAEVVGGRWLVNTPLTTGTLVYDRHDTSSRVPLPAQTFWVDVPMNAILHIGDLALFYLSPDQIEAELEVPEFFAERALELQPATVDLIQFEGAQLINLEPLENTIQEIESRPPLTVRPLLYSWSTPDSLLAIWVTVASIVGTTITIISFKNHNELKAKFQRFARGWRRSGRARPRGQEADPAEGNYLDAVDLEAQFEQGVIPLDQIE